MTRELNSILFLLKANKEYFHEKYGVSEIAVFGSATRDDFTDKSDIDLLVGFDRRIGLEFVSLADELEQLLGRKVDLAMKGGIKDHWMKVIEEDLVNV